MASDNEHEIRVSIANPEDMKRFLEERYGKPEPYAFTDSMYKPY